jgi:hypothetical protein
VATNTSREKSKWYPKENKCLLIAALPSLTVLVVMHRALCGDSRVPTRERDIHTLLVYQTRELPSRIDGFDAVVQSLFWPPGGEIRLLGMISTGALSKVVNGANVRDTAKGLSGQTHLDWITPEALR